jgi:Pvc16 N-terminal domain
VLGRVLQVLNDHGVLRGSELADPLDPAVDELRVNLETLSLEELTRIWNALQVPLELCASYCVQVVSLDSHHEPVSTSPVLERDSEYHQVVGSGAAP